MDGLDRSFAHLSDEHSWYKHLPLRGRDFVLTLCKGEQFFFRSLPTPDADHFEGPHWHFHPDTDYRVLPPLEVPRVPLNCFLRGVFPPSPDDIELGINARRDFLGDAIFSSFLPTPDFQEWLQDMHPDLHQRFASADWRRRALDEAMADLVDREWRRMRNAARTAAQQALDSGVFDVSNLQTCDRCPRFDELHPPHGTRPRDPSDLSIWPQTL